MCTIKIKTQQLETNVKYKKITTQINANYCTSVGCRTCSSLAKN